MLDTLIVLTSIPVIVILFGLIFGHKWSSNFKFPYYLLSILSLFVIGLLGWIFVGNVGIDKICKEPVNIPSNHITKTDYAVIVYDEGNTIVFDKKIDYDNIDSTTKFYYLVNYNMYGKPINKILSYEK